MLHFNYLVLNEVRNVRYSFLVSFIAALGCIKDQVRHYVTGDIQHVE
jgi:hypothetical protein